jgi:hypothetical protein
MPDHEKFIEKYNNLLSRNTGQESNEYVFRGYEIISGYTVAVFLMNQSYLIDRNRVVFTKESLENRIETLKRNGYDYSESLKALVNWPEAKEG